jgi:hypothetical protein
MGLSCELAVDLRDPCFCIMKSRLGEVSTSFDDLSGFLEGSKLIILIFGIQFSGGSESSAFAVRFLLRDGGVDVDGEDEDMVVRNKRRDEN